MKVGVIYVLFDDWVFGIKWLIKIAMQTNLHSSCVAGTLANHS